MDLSRYDALRHDSGANFLTRILWYMINPMVFNTWLFPFYGFKRLILKVFGAKIGIGVVIKPRVNIKYPWRLSIGAYSWVGEGVWIDSIGMVHIGSHCCISQGAYLCTGNHDWSDPCFGLKIEPIIINDHAWVGAFSIICPGACISTGAVITAGSVITNNTVPWTIYSGNPAVARQSREISETHKVL